MHRIRNHYERESKVPIFIAGMVVIIIVIGLFVLLFHGGSKYKEYNSYNENNKKYGTVEHYEKENDNFYVINSNKIGDNQMGVPFDYDTIIKNMIGRKDSFNFLFIKKEKTQQMIDG